MKQIIDKIKLELKKDGFNAEEIVKLLKELRTDFKSNLKEPGLVRMLRLAYEDIEANGVYTFIYMEEDSAKENFEYMIDLIADHNNKYNKEELQDIRNLMDGIEPEPEEEEGTEA
jgi:hypothetical protein